MAAIFGFREVRAKRSAILEPVMHVEVETPKSTPGIQGDLFPSRDGAGDGRALRAPDHPRRMPLAEMFGYSTTLRSMSQDGNLAGCMEFHHYAEAPRNVADEIIASREKQNVPGCDARRLTPGLLCTSAQTR